jgi:hypothetical protein
MGAAGIEPCESGLEESGAMVGKAELASDGREALVFVLESAFLFKAGVWSALAAPGAFRDVVDVALGDVGCRAAGVAGERLVGPGEGVDAVVVSCVREGCDLVEELGDVAAVDDLDQKYIKSHPSLGPRPLAAATR